MNACFEYERFGIFGKTSGDAPHKRSVFSSEYQQKLFQVARKSLIMRAICVTGDSYPGSKELCSVHCYINLSTGYYFHDTLLERCEAHTRRSE